MTQGSAPRSSFPVPCSLFFILILSACAAPRPTPDKPPPPPPLQTVHVLDDRSFAFDVTFLPGDLVGCALMEDGVYRLAIHDEKTGKRLRHVHLGKGQDWLHAMAVAPKGDLLAVGFRKLRKDGPRLVARGSVAIYHLPTGRLQREFLVSTPVRDLVWKDNDVIFATEAQYVRRGKKQEPKPGTAQVCLLSVGRGIQHCVADHTDTVTSVAPLQNGGFATGSWDRTVRLRDSSLEPKGEPLRTAGHVNALAADIRGRLAVATSHEPPRRSREVVLREQRDEHRRKKQSGDAVELWDLASLGRLQVMRPHLAQVTEVALAPGGGAVASGSWDWSVALRRGRHAVRLSPFSQIVTGLAFHPGVRLLAVSAWSEHRSGAPSWLLVRY